MEPWTGVHDLVHVLLLRVDVAVEVDDPELALDRLRHAASAWEADGVVTTHDHRKRA